MSLLSPIAISLALAAALAAGILVFWRIATRFDPSFFFFFYFAIEIFSGWFHYIHVPTGFDRAVLVAGLATLWIRRGELNLKGALKLRFEHWLMIALVIYATLSAIFAHTFSTQNGFFAILDRLGAVPFLIYWLGPVIFRGEKQRRTFLALLVCMGAYLSYVAIMEGTGNLHLIFPSYIQNPALGIHFGRARGPFLEATADGIALFACAVASAIAYRLWTSKRLKYFAVGVGVACLIGDAFTLTREVWIGAVLGISVTLVANPKLRRFLVPSLAGGLAAVGAILLVDRSFLIRAESRTTSTLPVWDRLNVAEGALRAIQAHPLFGIGWERFLAIGYLYQRQSPAFPLTKASLEVHNLFLGDAAGMGILGLVLVLSVIAFGLGKAIFSGKSPQIDPWRFGLLALAICWLTVANFSPMAPAFPTLLLWTWAGLVAAGRNLGNQDSPYTIERIETKVGH